MSYSINISGHKNVSSPEEGKEFEEEVASKARRFVLSIEGVSSASGSFGSIGYQNLLKEPEDDAGEAS